PHPAEGFSMRVIVIGGHGRTGLLIVEKLIAAGDSVVATIRNPRHMADLVKRGAETIVLDLETSPLFEFTTAMKGADAVVFAAGSGAGQTSELDRIGVRRTLHAAQNAGVRRYVAISSIGASTGLSTRKMSDEMKDYYKQKRAAAKFIHASGLDWTILEPGELTDAPGTGKVSLSEAAIEGGSIPREDVAATIVAVLAEPRSAGHTFQLVSGDTPIAAALKAALR
ncbi:MAG: NAD-dependent dehydratase, partial [Devosia sp.]|uniref:NAD(P)-binding oxidoreductase n=1 Tax=Devosia sp. TaxID=1871048 RepID=UPI002624A8F6